MTRLARALTCLSAAACLTLPLVACDDDGGGQETPDLTGDTSTDTGLPPQDTSLVEDTASLDGADGDPDDLDTTPDDDASDTVSGDTSDDATDVQDEDTAQADGSDADATDADVEPPPAAEDYCETTAAMFCDFYLRCGRMAVADEAECMEVFAESCNARYEPLYVALADAGRMTLSPAGIEACADHLATVTCDHQPFDLDGPCGQVWQGQEPAGGDCGPSLDYYVCAPGTACVLDLSFCGTCTPAAELGQACGEGTTCARDARCIEGVCVARGLPGEACDEATAPCIVGARCVDSVCVGLDYVAVGESCDQVRRCPYKAACVGGVCVEQSLQGELCGAGGCATGTCDDTDRCVALSVEGESCSSGSQCVSQICDEASQTCAPISAGFCGE